MVTEEIKYCPTCNSGVLKPYSYHDNNLGNTLVKGMKCGNCYRFLSEDEIKRLEKSEPVVVDKTGEDSVSCNVDAAPGSVCPVCSALHCLSKELILHPEKMYGFRCSKCLTFFSNSALLKFYSLNRVEKNGLSLLKEDRLLKKTTDLWNEYIKLDNIDDCESLEIASAIHTIQGRLAIRMHRRDVKDSPFCKQEIDGKD